MNHRRRAHGIATLALALTCTAAARPAVADPPVVVHPGAVDPGTEVVDPLRGYFRWYDQEQAPQPHPAYDAYARFTWRELEPSQGSYDFSEIDTALTAAHAAGQRFGFRVMPVNEGEGPTQVPQYLVDQGVGEWCDGSTFTPHWNDARYLTAARALMHALGARYDTDPRLDYYDMGLYGHWGEWHTFGLCGDDATSETKHALVDMQIDAFPHARVIMNSGGGEVDAFVYALGRSPAVGVRCDSFGAAWFTQQFMNDPAKWAAVRDRWMTAPVIAEYFGGSSNDYALAVTQVGVLHVAAIGDGNFDWTSLSGDQQQQALAAGRAAGYRFALATASYAPGAAAGSVWALETDWQNTGATPAYEHWAVTWELRDASGHVAASTASSLDLEHLLPTSAPAHTHDAWTLPAALAPGDYALDVAVLDPTGYRAPLTLAIRGVDADGRFALGTLHVTAATSVPDAGVVANDAGHATGDAGHAASDAGHAADDAGARAPIEGSCGCRVVRPTRGTPWLVVVAALAALAARRRRAPRGRRRE